MINKLIGNLFCSSYQAQSRFRSKAFSILVSGAFYEFGKRSILVPPISLNRVERIKIGSGVFIGSNSWLQTLPDGSSNTPAISIGNNTSIAGYLVISAVRRVTIEEDVLIARNLYVSDHKHKYTNDAHPICDQGIDNIKPVLIRQGSWIGQNVVIAPGVIIGINSVIGANSFVNTDIPDYSVAAGTPARIIKTIK